MRPVISAGAVRRRPLRPGSIDVREDNLRILAGSSNLPLAQSIADHLDIPLCKMLLSRFADGEIRVKIEESMRGMDVFVIQSTSKPVNEHVMELLIMLDALRRASVERITAVTPYYGYARQDKKVKPREPITARLIADLLTLAGANRVLALDLHAEQLQGFFTIPVDHLYGGPLIADYLLSQKISNSDTVVVSPDDGGVERAQSLAQQLDTGLAIIFKRRPEPGRSEVISVVGQVKDKTCVLVDDIIDTGGSILGGVQALKEQGAGKIIVACTHGVFSGPAFERLNGCEAIHQVIHTDTIYHPDREPLERFKCLSVAPLLAEAIDRIHRGASVSELFLPII